MTRKDKIQLAELLHERNIRSARTDLARFVTMTNRAFIWTRFHKSYYRTLEAFARGEMRKVMVFTPPQCGKSEGSTRRLPAYLLGQNPDQRIAIVSYSAAKARKFNREIQRIIDSPEYRAIFPATMLDGSGAQVQGSWVRTADEFEIVGHSGSVKTVGVGGALTGESVDILIMDDLYKDAQSAWSPTIREGVDDWYNTVAQTRLHNESRQLLVFTRWHEDDLAGVLLREQGEYSAENPDGWHVVKFPAIKVGKPTSIDPRGEGEALWPERHSLDDLLDIRKRNSLVFESLYQQNPTPTEGLLYDRSFATFERIPETRRHTVCNITDPADTGADSLCSITYIDTEIGAFVIDVIFTAKPSEVTEQMVADTLNRNAVEVARVESNGGGGIFARNVERICRTNGNYKTRFFKFAQTKNKEARIFTRAGEVMNTIHFPVGWERLYPDFAKEVTGFLRIGKNPHDDAPDVLTYIVENRDQKSIRFSNIR